VRERAVPTLSNSDIEAALAQFIGSISQVPPIYSALKQACEPLYVKARRGELVDVAARVVHIDSIDVLALDGDEVSLRVECGSGTYIRSLICDLGTALGCGAHVKSLRRLWVEPFRAPEMHTIDEIERVAADGFEALDRLLLPIESGLASFPRIDVSADEARRLGQGQALQRLADGRASTLAAYTSDGRVLGLVHDAGDGLVRPKRLFQWAAIGRQD
jgi:tRNA pseudouridine55 synthase